MRSNVKSNSKRKMTIFIVVLCVLLLGVGFAYLSQALKISNTATISTNSWSVHLENVEVKDGSVSAPMPIIRNDSVSMTASVTLNKPLDFYEYYVDVVNDGTLDARLDSFEKTILTESQQKYLNYTITYKDLQEISQNDLLAVGERETLRILIEMKDVEDASDLPTEAVVLTLESQLNYVQDDGNGVPRNATS